MKFLLSNKSARKNSFVIVIILFVISYSFLSYNIENQGINLDEVFHHGYAMSYFDLLKDGKIFDPCITGIGGECELIDLECSGENGKTFYWIGSGGIIKGVLVGFGDYLFSENERVYYASTFTEPCRPIHKNADIPGVNIPTQSELSAARFFSPILGSLTVVIAFLIGNLLFNRFIGISFSIILLFHALWMHSSRILTSEVYVNFFMLLSVFLLLYSLREHKIQIKYFILSAITFALSVNTKMTILEVLPFLLIIIFFRESWENTFSLKKLKEKFFVLKSLSLVLIFLSIFIASMFLTFPYYYPDPIDQLGLQLEIMDRYSPISDPLSHTKKIFLPFVESATIAPIMDSYYLIFSPDQIPQSASYGHTFSSIPLSLFFIFGIFYLFSRIKTKKLQHSEFIILTWYFVIYVILSLTNESYNNSRHFIPIIFPMILIMSYGLWRFIQYNIHKKIKIIFFSLTMFAHAITFLVFWKKIYFEPSYVWIFPVGINLRNSLSEPIVQISGIIFIIVLIILMFKKIRTTSINGKEKIS